MIDRIPVPATLNETLKNAHAQLQTPEVLRFTLLGPYQSWVTLIQNTPIRDVVRWWFEDSIGSAPVFPFATLEKKDFEFIIEEALSQRRSFTNLVTSDWSFELIHARNRYGKIWELLKYLLDCSYLMISGQDVYLIPQTWNSFQEYSHFDKPQIIIQAQTRSLIEALTYKPEVSRSIALKNGRDIQAEYLLLGEYGDIIFADQLPKNYEFTAVQPVSNPFVNPSDTKFYSVNSPLKKEMFPVENHEWNTASFVHYFREHLGTTARAIFAIAQIDVPLYNLSSIPVDHEITTFTWSKNVLITTLTYTNVKRWTKPSLVLNQILKTIHELSLEGTYPLPNDEAFKTWGLITPRFSKPVIVENDLSSSASYFKMIELNRYVKADPKWEALETKNKKVLSLTQSKNEIENRISRLTADISNSVQLIADAQAKILRSESAKSAKAESLTAVANQLALLQQSNDSIQQLISDYKNVINQKDLHEFVEKAANLNFRISKLVFTPRAEPSQEKTINFDDKTKTQESILDELTEVIEKDYIFHKIGLSTIKPSLIKDARKSNAVVIAGPFDIELQRGSMTIRSSSGYSYGSKAIKLVGPSNATEIRYEPNYKCHPHASSTATPVTGPIATQPSTWVSFCLGEGQTLFYHCFEKKDYSSLLIVLKSLLETFDSHDHYGASCVNFVKYTNQSFEGYKINGID